MVMQYGLAVLGRLATSRSLVKDVFSMRFFYIFSFLFLFGGVALAQEHVLSMTSDNFVVGSSNGTLSVMYDNNGVNEVAGWSFGVCNDPAILTVTDVADGAATATIAGGDPPGFNATSYFPEGFTKGVVIDLFGAFTLPPGVGNELNIATYDAIAEGTTDVAMCDEVLGSPPVAVAIVVGGASISPDTVAGSVTVEPIPPTTPFIRGDVNGDDKVNIADGIWLIYELHIGGPASTCPISRDANGDGSVDIADAIFVFEYRFQDGPAPSDPFPGCGQVEDQTADDCASSFCG